MKGVATQTDPGAVGLLTSNKIRTGFIPGATFEAKSVQYADLNGVAMFEGDIVLGTVEKVEAFTEQVQEQREGISFGIGITGERFRWPKGVIPYRIADDLPNQSRVTDAIAHWESNTHIRFVQRTDANAAQYPNFVTFRPGDGCSSMVGMQGGEQFVTLGEGCLLGQAIHEIGHAVGLWHEQSREDRDTHITINWANIQAGTEHNFNQHIADGDDIGEYDFGSIMHYGATAFSSNGQPTIVAVGGQAIGQRGGLSAGDIAAVRALYPQLEPSRTWAAVLFRQTVPANNLGAWASPQWPAYWNVVFTAVPLSPVQDSAPQISLRVQAGRYQEALLKYTFIVTNASANPVDFEIRYEVLGWAN